MAYPDTNLVNDQLDPPYGGIPANKFGTPQRTFIDAVLRFLSNAYIVYLRKPWMSWVVTVSSDCAAGDVAVIDPSHFVSGQGYYVGKAATLGIDSPNQILGVFLESASNGGKARVAFCGIIPPSITGLGVLTANEPLTCDATTGRLRVATTGETVIAYADIQGNALLLAPGRSI